MSTTEQASLLDELNLRDMVVTQRLASNNPDLRKQGRRDEHELLAITMSLDEHPDEYEGRCLCRMCASYTD